MGAPRSTRPSEGPARAQDQPCSRGRRWGAKAGAKEAGQSLKKSASTAGVADRRGHFFRNPRPPPPPVVVAAGMEAVSWLKKACSCLACPSLSITSCSSSTDMLLSLARLSTYSTTHTHHTTVDAAAAA